MVSLSPSPPPLSPLSLSPLPACHAWRWHVGGIRCIANSPSYQRLQREPRELGLASESMKRAALVENPFVHPRVLNRSRRGRLSFVRLLQSHLSLHFLVRRSYLEAHRHLDDPGSGGGGGGGGREGKKEGAGGGRGIRIVFFCGRQFDAMIARRDGPVAPLGVA